MWRSFFFAVGAILIFLGLQCLVFEEFRIDKNSRLFAVAQKANLAFDQASGQPYPHSNGLQSQYGQAPTVANQQRFSLPSAESYYGGTSRFQTSSYSAYNGRFPNTQQSPLVNRVSSSTNVNGFRNSNNIAATRIKDLRSYPVKDWMPWGFLAAGTIISLYTNSLGHSRYSGD